MKTGMHLQVFGPQACVLCDAAQDAATQLLIVVKCELVVRPSFTSQQLVGANLAFDPPADALQSG